MKLLHYALLPGVVLLTACERDNAVPPPQTGVVASVAAVAEPALDQSRLTQFHWRLHDASDPDGDRVDELFGDVSNRVQIDFDENRLAIIGACNQIGGSYTIDRTTLKPGQLVQTMKACEDNLMRREAALKSYFEGDLQIQLSDSEAPLLTLIKNDGSTLIFEGVTTAESRYGTESELVFLEVQPLRVSCHHPMMPDHECLQVRDVVYDEEGAKVSVGEWQFLYQEIEGYSHEPGVRTILRLKRFPLINPPADGPGVAYVLDMAVESEIREENIPATAP